MSKTRILVAHASRHGSTREVADAVAAGLRARGFVVDVMPAAEVGLLRGYAGVVLGGALYTGRLHKDARRFLVRHRKALAGRALAVFALGPRTLQPADVAASRTQLDRALRATPELMPVSAAIFGGVVKSQDLRFPFNRMPAGDARDWEAIDAWVRALPLAASASAAAVPAGPGT